MHPGQMEMARPSSRVAGGDVVPGVTAGHGRRAPAAIRSAGHMC